MSQKRFVVRRVGGEYQIEPSSVKSLDAEDMSMAIGGAFLVLLGLSRRSTPGAILMGVGAMCAWHGYKGRKRLRKRVVRAAKRLGRLGSAQGGPSHQHESEGTGQSPEDQVDEESMESFPASDAPSHGSSAR
jgi:hypothetical protein